MNLSYLDNNELVVLINALELLAEELPEDDEDQPVIATVKRIAEAQQKGNR